LPGTLVALLLSAGLAAWIWTGTAGSLAQALGWAQGWMQHRADSTGQLQTRNALGNLRQGGRIEQLEWSRAGLRVQAQGVTLGWNPALVSDLLLGRGVRLQRLDIEQLTIDDQRAPKPGVPLESLVLPLPVSLPWSVGRLELTGRNRLVLERIGGQYRYGPADAAARNHLGSATALGDVHQLGIDSLQLAQGRYQLQAVLGAQAPMPLRLTAQGEVLTSVPGGNSLTLQATASATGTLAGSGAALTVTARITPTTESTSTAGTQTTPTLAATARVMPWAPQPLSVVDASAHRLNLAALWPQAPQTALTGAVRAQPDGPAWLAQVALDNTISGPWDQQRLPIERLQAQLQQRDGRWLIPQLSARLGRASLQASGEFQPASATTPAQWLGQLQATGLNPAQLWSSLAPAALDATLSARTAAARSGTAPAIDLDARILPSASVAAPAAQQGLRLRELRLLGQWRPAQGGGALQLDTAVLDAAQARLNATGLLQLNPSTFAGSATLQLPGAQGGLDGALAHADGRGDVQLGVDDAAALLDWLRGLQRLPVIGPQLGRYWAQNPALRDLQLSGQARLSAQWTGGLAELGVPTPANAQRSPVPLRVQLEIDVPRLEGSTPSATSPTSTNSATWSLRQAQLQASGSLAELALQLRGEAALAPWRASVQTAGLLRRAWPLPGPGNPEPGRLELSSLQLQASDGSRSDRVVDWSIGSPQALSLSWRHTPDGLALQSGPGRLQVQPSIRPLGNGQRMAAPLASGPLTLAWSSLAWQAGALQSQGRLSGLPLSWVDALATAQGAASGPITQAGVGGDLLFDGDWDILLPMQAGTPLRLTAQLQRRSGDLSVRTDGSQPEDRLRNAGTALLQAGVREARLSVNAEGRAVQARLRWDSERLGQASADLGTELAAQPAATGNALDRWWPGNAPLRGTVSAQLPQVGVWSALAPPGWRMRGTLQADATLGGTRAAPQWRGQLQADQLGLRSVVDGFAFSNGVLRATLEGERIAIDRFELQGPQGGSLSATGQAQWRLVDGQRQPFIELQATARQLRVSNRADRRLTLSGQVTAQLSGPRLQIRGQLVADSALFVLPDETTPTLGADVVVRGGRNLPQGTSTVAQVQPDVAVELDLGPQFDVRGRGLQTRLGGQLNLRSTPALREPRVFGEVRTVSGSYRAYGQQLTIDNGLLAFNGPYDDPALDILAIRPMGSNTTQRVGVQINGSAQSPRVRLVATPDMPDGEKLAWLVLGRPATGAGAEAAVLQQAALALLSGNNGNLDGGLAQALGLDELSYRGEGTNADGSTTAAAVTLGKRISNDLYLSYETSLAGAMGTVSIFYDVSRRFTLRARAGEENALDLIFTLTYD
jgi:translocation and assembly module TamB